MVLVNVCVQSVAFIVESFVIRKQYAQKTEKSGKYVRYDFVWFVHKLKIVCASIIYVFIVLLIKMNLLPLFVF